MLAAKEETRVFPLAAFCLIGENSRLGHRLPTAALHLGFAPLNSSTATGFAPLMCDDGRRSRNTGKERDTETGLDYFGARYYGGGMGRFTTTDPIQILPQKLLDPQQWNMYAYVRNNPLRLVDPTGMYVCGGTSKECDAFEKSRQADLKSKDSGVRRGASAYGDRGQDNGVRVAFGDPGAGRAGNATARLELDPKDPMKFRAAISVVIGNDQSGTALAGTVAHEGVHVADAQDFAATVTMDGQYDFSKNLMSLETEVNAYAASAAVQAASGQQASFGKCSGGQCVFGPGMSADQVLKTTLQLLANPANGYNRWISATGPDGRTWANSLGLRQFPVVTGPAPPKQ